MRVLGEEKAMKAANAHTEVRRTQTVANDDGEFPESASAKEPEGGNRQVGEEG